MVANAQVIARVAKHARVVKSAPACFVALLAALRGGLRHEN